MRALVNDEEFSDVTFLVVKNGRDKVSEPSSSLGDLGNATMI